MSALYLEHLQKWLTDRFGTDVETLSTEATLEVRWEVFRRITAVMPNPLLFTGSAQAIDIDKYRNFWTYYWGFIPEDIPHSELSDIRKFYSGDMEVIIMFELAQAHAIQVVLSDTVLEKLEGVDAYVIGPNMKGPLVVFTHELAYGPIILE